MSKVVTKTLIILTAVLLVCHILQVANGFSLNRDEGENEVEKPEPQPSLVSDMILSLARLTKGLVLTVEGAMAKIFGERNRSMADNVNSKIE
ncbi:hypothetical protein CHUAL_003016 [Chamberlinius hualienensis]